MKVGKLLYYSALYGASAAILKVIGFVVVVWLARTLTVEGYAEFGLFYALYTGLGTFAIAGIFEVVVGFLNSIREPDARARLYSLANTAFLILGLGCALAAWLVHLALPGDQQHSQAVATFAYAALSGLALAFATLQQHIMRLEERHTHALLFGFAVPAAGLIGAVGAFYIGPTVVFFFLGLALGQIAALLALACFKVGHYQHAPDARSLRAFFAKAPPFFLIAVFGWLSGYGNNYLVQGLLNSSEVAKFTFALSISSTIQLVATAFNQVWVPRFFRLSQELQSADVERQNRQAFRWLAIALGLSGAILLLLFSPVLDRFGGNLVAYRSMQFELLLMIVAYIVVTAWWHCHSYFLMHELGAELMKVALVSSIIGTLVGIVLMLLIGSVGVYLGFLAVMGTRAAIIVLAARKRWRVTIGWEGIVIGSLIAWAGYLLSKSV